LLVPIKAGRLLSDQELSEIKVESEVRDGFTRTERERVIHAPGAQVICRIGRGYFDGVAECHCRQPCRLPMKPDLRAKPIVSEGTVSARLISLREKGRCVPTQLNVTKQSEFQEAIARGLTNAFLRPHAIQTVL
jgi:hypothetical protein